MLNYITLNYDLFKFLPQNRVINQIHLAKLIKSIQEKDLCKCTPILVDENYLIYDGQHRFTACKALALPIYYNMHKGLTFEDAIRCNINNKNWLLEDYLHCYCASKYVEYVKLNDFIKSYDIENLSQILHLLSYAANNKSKIKEFKLGKFKFPENVDYVLTIINRIAFIKDFLNIHYNRNKAFLNSTGFVNGLSTLMKHPKYNYDLFIKNLSRKMDWLHSCTNWQDYFNMFKVIHNFLSKDPID